MSYNDSESLHGRMVLALYEWPHSLNRRRRWYESARWCPDRCPPPRAPDTTPVRPYQTPPTVPALDIAALAPRLGHKLLYQPATQTIDRHFYLHQRTRLLGSPYLDALDRRLKYRANIIAAFRLLQNLLQRDRTAPRYQCCQRCQNRGNFESIAQWSRPTKRFSRRLADHSA